MHVLAEVNYEVLGIRVGQGIGRALLKAQHNLVVCIHGIWGGEGGAVGGNSAEEKKAWGLEVRKERKRQTENRERKERN